MSDQPRWCLLYVVDARWTVAPSLRAFTAPEDAGVALAIDSSRNLLVLRCQARDGRLLAVDLATGEELWRADIPLDRRGAITSWGAGGLLASWSGGAARLGRERPVLFETPRVLVRPVLSGDGLVSCALTSDALIAWDELGRRSWELALDEGPVTPPWPVGERGFVLGHAGGLSTVADGRIVSHYAFDVPTRAIVRGRVDRDTLVVELGGSMSAQLVRVDLSGCRAPLVLSGAELAQTPGNAGPTVVCDRSCSRFAMVGPQGLVAPLRAPRPRLARFPPAAPGLRMLWFDRHSRRVLASDERGRRSWSIALGPSGDAPLVSARHLLDGRRLWGTS
ncbi:MAG: PQQ-binding-like beta-propeller repeat protein [Enhygromyxa sp.]